MKTQDVCLELQTAEPDVLHRPPAENTSPAFFYQHDGAGRFVYVSSTVRDVIGYEPQELLGKTFFELIPDAEERARAVQRTEAAIRDPSVRAVYTAEYQCKDGRRVTLEIAKMLLGRNGVPLLMYGVARDITAHQRTVDQLTLSVDILKGVDAIIVVCNGKGETTYVNPAACKLFGTSAEDVHGDAIWRKLTQCDAEAIELRERIARFARGDEPIPKRPEIRKIFDCSGEPRWLVWRGTKGPADLFIGFAQDITPVFAAEDALRKSELRLRAIFDCSLDGMLLVDDQCRCVDANPAACTMFGVSLAELIGRSVDSKFDHRACESLGRTGSMRGETSIRRPDGKTVQVEYSGRANIQPGQHLFLIRDITERKKLEAQLRQSQKMEAVGRLAGGVAHDFNNMLTVIRGYSELLQKKADGNAELLRYADCILNAADRAALITQQLLAFSRRQVIQPQKMNLNSVVEDTARLLRRVIGEDITLKLALNSQLASIKADPGQIGQIILNLAVNARDAMPVGGHLQIETENVSLSPSEALKDMGMPPGEYAVLRVTDSGCGMSKETQAHIFEPFFTTKPQGKGTGLGLATVYGIVKQSGGWIEVISAVNQGTTFKIYFPPCAEEEKAAQTSSPAVGREAQA